MTTQADDRDEETLIRCRECGEEFTPIEMQGDFCIDCVILMQRLNQKKKGYKNDVSTSN